MQVLNSSLHQQASIKAEEKFNNNAKLGLKTGASVALAAGAGGLIIKSLSSNAKDALHLAKDAGKVGFKDKILYKTNVFLTGLGESFNRSKLRGKVAGFFKYNFAKMSPANKGGVLALGAIGLGVITTSIVNLTKHHMKNKEIEQKYN